ncbi:MAG: type II secretion system F family protein [Pirellulaceae bacterium]
MNQSLGPFNLVLLAIPGMALLLCVRLLYGRKPSAVPDSALLLLRIGGRLMLLAALGGAIFSTMGWITGIAAALVILVIWVMTLDRRMRLEHQALLASIGVAAEKGIPLPEVVLAFADEMNSGGARRALWLAQALQQGVPLDQALSYAWIKCSTATRMAVRVGLSLGALAPALRTQAAASHELEDLVRPMFTRWVYLLHMLLAGEFIVTFIMIWIVPVFDQMFSEFGLKLPVMTVLLINFSRWIVDYGWIPLFLLTMAAFLACLAGICAFIGWLPRSAPILNRMFRRYDGAIVLRSLALAIRRGQTLSSSLRLMADIYPLGTVRTWLSRASTAVEGGQDWCEALRRVRLIDSTDAVVLRAAQGAGNLPWALEEMAESLLRREIYRWQAWYNILAPLMVLVMGGCVGFVVVSLFLPLVGLIQGLA